MSDRNQILSKEEQTLVGNLLQSKELSRPDAPKSVAITYCGTNIEQLLQDARACSIEEPAQQGMSDSSVLFEKKFKGQYFSYIDKTPGAEKLIISEVAHNGEGDFGVRRWVFKPRSEGSLQSLSLTGTSTIDPTQ